jgi:Mg-chelatase subunit ChlD
MQSLFLTILVALFPMLSTVATMGQVDGNMPNADVSRASYARTIILAVDVSDTMQGSSLTQMQATMTGLINQLDTTTAVGLVTFGSSVTTVQPPTTDRAVLTETIKSLTAKGKRSLYEGALTAVRLANDTPSAERAVVVISCGWEYSETSTATRNRRSTQLAPPAIPLRRSRKARSPSWAAISCRC